MIHKVGLLPADNFQQVPFAYKMYTRDDVVGWQQSTAFRQAFSVKVDIEFIGVWLANPTFAILRQGLTIILQGHS